MIEKDFEKVAVEAISKLVGNGLQPFLSNMLIMAATPVEAPDGLHANGRTDIFFTRGSADHPWC